jgi:methylglutaconyl-CoA hydratase
VHKEEVTVGELVRYQVARGIATIALDSPGNRNALSSRLQTELREHLHEALDDATVRILVLTGTGPVFCSGADLAEHRAGTVTAAPEVMSDILMSLWNSPKPVLGRINGHARAGGLGLVSACDIAVAAQSASFGFAEVRIGVLPAMIAVTCLPRMTPRGALEVFLTGESFGASRAVELGLLNRAVPDDDLDAEVARFADMLMRGGPEALAGVKPMIRQASELPMAEAFEAMAKVSLERFGSREAHEGLAAFAEKRIPRWVAG